MKNQLMTHIVAGYPSLSESEQIARLMLDSGVSYLEIQIPFSDPIADGPTLAYANHQALDAGITVKDSFDLMRRLTADYQTPILFMTYFNIVFQYGVEQFCQDAAAAGCYGLIVPDVPLDEEPRTQFLALCKKHGLKAIQVISPLTTDERLQHIAQVADGFVYCVGRTGVTGASSDVSAQLGEYLTRVRKHIDLPLAVGFGISSRDHVQTVLEHADCAIIGSKIVSLYDNAPQGKGLEIVGDFLHDVLRP